MKNKSPSPIIDKLCIIITFLCCMHVHDAEAKVVAKSSILLDVKPVSVQYVYGTLMLHCVVLCSGMMRQVR